VVLREKEAATFISNLLFVDLFFSPDWYTSEVLYVKEKPLIKNAKNNLIIVSAKKLLIKENKLEHV